MTAPVVHPSWCETRSCDGLHHATTALTTVASAVLDPPDSPSTGWHLDTDVSVRGETAAETDGDGLAVCLHLSAPDEDDQSAIDVEVWLTLEETTQLVHNVQLVLGQLGALGAVAAG